MKTQRMSHVSRWLPWIVPVVLAAGCGHPFSMQNEWVLHQMTTHYRDFYPDRGDPDLARDAGLLSPRFGFPAIAQSGSPFSIELLERGEPQAPRAALVQPELSIADAQLCLSGGCRPPAACR